jgi:hypothetical protein
MKWKIRGKLNEKEVSQIFLFSQLIGGGKK